MPEKKENDNPFKGKKEGSSTRIEPGTYQSIGSTAGTPTMPTTQPFVPLRYKEDYSQLYEKIMPFPFQMIYSEFRPFSSKTENQRVYILSTKKLWQPID